MSAVGREALSSLSTLGSLSCPELAPIQKGLFLPLGLPPLHHHSTRAHLALWGEAVVSQ